MNIPDLNADQLRALIKAWVVARKTLAAATRQGGNIEPELVSVFNKAELDMMAAAGETP